MLEITLRVHFVVRFRYKLSWEIIGVAMTFVLGAQSGIESLKSDVLAIHNATKGVLAKVGDFHVPSWRFPDKLGTNVDLEALLKDLRYTNSHDKDSATHVLLLELTVDRFSTFYSSLTKFAK